MNLFSDILKGERIELRVLKPTFENINMIWDVYSHNREFVTRFDEDNLETKEQFLIGLNFASRPESKNKDWFIFLDDKLIGHINIWNYSKENKKCEIAYWLAEIETGKGYITEAMKLVEKELFNNDINRIELICDTQNIASRRVAERSGYALEGIKRKSCIYKNGRVADDCLYAKLREDL